MTEPKTGAPILVDIDPRGVAHVVLNRPERNNAYDGALIQALLAALDTLERTRGLRAVVISGNGRHFQAGADLQWIDTVRTASRDDNIAASRATAQAIWRLNAAPVPTVALVQGACFGGGTGLVAACDIVIAAEDAVFSIAEVRWGLTAAIIIPQLNDAIGVRQVRRYALTGERFSAAEAHRIGLVHDIVPAAELQAAGARIVEAVLQNGPQAIAQTKALTLESCDFLRSWHPRQVASVQHGVGERGAKSAVTGELVAGPVTLPDAELAKNCADSPGEAKRRRLMDDYYVSRTALFEDIETPLLAAANWGGMGLHTRGNFEGFLRAGSKQKSLEVHGDTHFTHFYSRYGETLQKRFFAIFSKARTPAGARCRAFCSTSGIQGKCSCCAARRNGRCSARSGPNIFCSRSAWAWRRSRRPVLRRSLTTPPATASRSRRRRSPRVSRSPARSPQNCSCHRRPAMPTYLSCCGCSTPMARK